MADSEKEQQQNQPTKTEEEQPPKEVIGMFFSIFLSTSRMFYTPKKCRSAILFKKFLKGTLQSRSKYYIESALERDNE